MSLRLPTLRLVIRDSNLRVVRDAASRGRFRNGGKLPARKLKRPVKTGTKRAAFLQWFLDDDTGRTIGATMATFGMSRPNVVAHWNAIHRAHGVGYSIHNTIITARLPANCDRVSVIGA